MNTNLPSRPKMDVRIECVLPADEKRRLFELAAARRVPVSQLIRQGIALVAAGDQEAA